MEEKKEKKLFVIHDRGDGEQNVNELTKEEVNEWMADGRLTPGDKIVYPAKVLIVKSQLKLRLEKETK